MFRLRRSWNLQSITQFISEVYLLKSLHQHPCHTRNPEDADAFVVPAQVVTSIFLSRGADSNSTINGREAPKPGSLDDNGASYRTQGNCMCAYRLADTSTVSPRFR